MLDRVVQRGAIAPQLWPLEAGNLLLAAERRGRIDAERRERLVHFLAELPIVIDPFTAERAWTSALILGARHRLTLYDAVYLELALRRRLPLATLDAALLGAAIAENVVVSLTV